MHSCQLDQEWLQEVGEVCEGEDLDRMMAQAIALEANKQATARDHLFGIDDRMMREDHFANAFRGELHHLYHTYPLAFPTACLLYVFAVRV